MSRSFIINWSLYVGVFIVGPLSGGIIGYVGYHYQIFPDIDFQWSMPIKLAFLAITLVLATFQYEYFYSVSTGLSEREGRGYGNISPDYIEQVRSAILLLQTEEYRQKQSEDRLADIHARADVPLTINAGELWQINQSIKERSEQIKRLRADLEKANSEIQRGRIEFQQIKSRVLRDFSIRLSLIFMVSILLLISLVLDLTIQMFIWFFAESLHPLIFSLSFGTFLVAIFYFFILTILFVLLIQFQLRTFYKSPA